MHMLRLGKKDNDYIQEGGVANSRYLGRPAEGGPGEKKNLVG
jgi:hypothetical protein